LAIVMISDQLGRAEQLFDEDGEDLGEQWE
jgi:hypothetical protein